MNSYVFRFCALVSVVALSACATNAVKQRTNNISTSDSQGKVIPEPESLSFPAVIDSARKIAPKNLEGREFNRFGLAYSTEELSQLDVSNMPAEKLQNYADIVTHAFPDAVFRQAPKDCTTLPFNQMNETTIAGMAYVSINAVSKETRDHAASCLKVVQESLK